MEAIGSNSFDAVYEAYAEIVYKTAMTYLQNHYAAEEIMQNVFLKYYIYREHARIKSVKGWLCMTAKHMALNEKKIRGRECLVEGLDEEEEEKYSLLSESPEDIFMRRLKEQENLKLTDDMFAALYHKNKRWYEAVTITYVLEIPQREVADIMGVSLEVLHSTLYRARKWLCRCYGQNYDHLE